MLDRKVYMIRDKTELNSWYEGGRVFSTLGAARNCLSRRYTLSYKNSFAIADYEIMEFILARTGKVLPSRKE